MPIPISENVRSIRAHSQVGQLFGEAETMRKEGKIFISLMTGDIFLPPSKEASKGGIRAIESDDCHYTPIAGYPELRAGVAKRLRTLHGLDYQSDEILISPGGALGLYYAALVMRTERSFLVPSPHWWSTTHQVRLAGGTSRVIATDSETLKVTPEILDAAMAGGGGTLILNHPTNPTGVVYTADELSALAEVLIAHDGYCIADETYGTMVYEGRFISMVAAHPGMRERTVIGDSFSKAYNMTGWRVGYLAGSRSFIQAAEMAQSAIALTASSISQRAALGALETPPEKLAADLEIHRNHRGMVMDMLGSMEGIRCAPPNAGIFAFPDVSSYYGLRIDGFEIASSTHMCRYLLRNHRVLTAPGCMFGSDRHIRLSFSLSRNELIQGLTRLGDAFTELRERGVRP